MIEYVWNEHSFEKSSVLGQSPIFVFNPLSANPPKMAKHTQIIRRQFADELF